LIADDHPVYRQGLERAIGEHPDLDLVGSTSDGRQAL
jgi:two-component system, NarL family, nitrate/nitrite response regulator NarL